MVERPARFRGKDPGWYDSKFKFEDFVGAAKPQVVEMMEVFAKGSIDCAECDGNGTEGRRTPSDGTRRPFTPGPLYSGWWPGGGRVVATW